MKIFYDYKYLSNYEIFIFLEQILPIQLAPDYADFTDLTETVYYPEDFNLAGLGNQTLSWSTTGTSDTVIERMIYFIFVHTKVKII